MTKQLNFQHSTSLRLPLELHIWILDYAKQQRTSTAYVYRQALWKLKEQITNASR